MISREQLLAAFGAEYRTLAGVGREFGVSRERIRQLVKRHGITRLEHPHAYSPRSRWPREGLKAFKRANGFCTRCSTVAAEGHTMCVECLEAQRVREKAGGYALKRAARFREQGVCYLCGKERVSGHSMCQYHRDYHRLYYHRRKATS